MKTLMEAGMITSWKCNCGQENSISIRYCPDCTKEIPDKIIEMITKEELSWAKDILQDETSSNRKERALKRHELVKKFYKPQIATTILIIALAAYLYLRMKAGVLSIDDVKQNVDKVVFSVASKVAEVIAAIIKNLIDKVGVLITGIISNKDKIMDRVKGIIDVFIK